MSRSYRSVRPKEDRVYSVEQVLDLYRVCRNTLSNWVGAGLRPVEDHAPHLYCGAELKRFHQAGALKPARRLGMAEFRCLRCKAAVIPNRDSFDFVVARSGGFLVRARCPDCDGTVTKLLSETDCTALRSGPVPNTNPGATHEESGAVEAGIGTGQQIKSVRWTPQNERIVFEYQMYGGRYDAKTLDAHLHAIRDFECFAGRKPFAEITRADADAYRQHLTARGNSKGEDRLGRSTVRHRASHLRGFFQWLVRQAGYRRMDQALPDYFVLPKQALARAITTQKRAFPDLAQVQQLFDAMPDTSLLARRDRAIIALLVLTGMRSDAVASIRLKHVDLDGRRILQDATEIRVKNAKSQTTRWFPFGDPFDQTLVDWVSELRDLNALPDDALFPPDEVINAPYRIRRDDREPIAPWQTDGPVRRVVRQACKRAGLPYFNPHAFKHFVASMSDSYCTSSEQRRAWSHNLGHENEAITRSHYAKMTDANRDRIFDQIGTHTQTTREEMHLALLYHEHRLNYGTPAFKQAEDIIQKWKAGVKGVVGSE